MMKAIISSAEGIQDVSDKTGELSISTSAKESARCLEADMIEAGLNPLLPGAVVALGNTVEILTEEGRSVFKGVVWDKEGSVNEMSFGITAYDMAVFLNKNEPTEQVYTEKTPQDIATQVCKEFGLKPGKLAPGDPVTVNGRGNTGYDIIMIAYTKQHDKDGKNYKLVAEGETIHVIENGEKHPLVLEELTQDLPGKILDLSYRQSMDDLVNAVTAVDESKEDEKTEEEDAQSQETFGRIQKLMRGDAGEVSGVLEKAKTELDVEVIADWDMMTGKSIDVKHRKIAGTFYIIADSHVYSDGIHTATLKLSTEYEMDTKTEGQQDSQIESTEDGDIQSGSTEEGDGQSTGKWLDPTKGAGIVSQGAHYHGNAIDIAAPVGTPLYASDGGTVSQAGFMGSYGNVVFINHAGGYQTRYAHMSSIGVRNGQNVSRGQVIGQMGSTGVSTGPHIHFEILNNGSGIYPGPLIGR